MELRARGFSIRAAAREVGASRSAGNNWARGYKTYRNGVLVGFVPPLDRLAVRQVSARFLSEDERIEIADLRRAGLSIRQIAHRLGRAPSTVSRELRRNATGRGGYRPFQAHRKATARRARHHRRRLETNHELRDLVAHLLAQRWSPNQISRHLKGRFPQDPLNAPLPREHLPGRLSARIGAVPAITAGPAPPFALAHRPRSPACPSTGRAAPAAVRAADAVDPSAPVPTPGPFAGRTLGGDLIIGKDQRSAIGTLVERKTRLVRLLHLPRRDGDTLHQALKHRTADLPASLLRSITWDQGTEMARHLTIAKTLGAPVYFCDSHSPWQRGSNENMNGLLRDYFPKGTNLSTHSAKHLLGVENELNRRPRLVLNNRAPADLFAALLASQTSQCCDVD